MFKRVLSTIVDIYKSLPSPPRVYYTELAPRGPCDVDFSAPPLRRSLKNTVMSGGVPTKYDWVGRVPDSSFKEDGILRGDLVLFLNTPIVGFKPRLHSYVLVPPIDCPDINTGWGQLVRIKEVNNNILGVSSRTNDAEICASISCSRVFALAVGLATPMRVFRHPPCELVRFPALEN